MNAIDHFWLWGALGAVLIGLTKTGIPGLGILVAALFANLMPAKQASGFVLPMLILGDVVAVWSYWRHADWRQLWRLMPWTALGVGIGWFAMSRIDDGQARLLVGIIVCTMTALHLWKRFRGHNPEPDSHGPWFAPLMGVLAGITTLVANAAGPLMTLYFLAMRFDKMGFIGTSAVFFFVLNLFKVPFMCQLGLIDFESVKTNLMLAVFVWGGAYAGRHILRRLPQRLFENIALLLATAAGMKLLF